MKLTIVTPLYNASSFIERMYYNVSKLLSSDIDWIIVNDCSTDDSLEKLLTITQEDKRITVTSLTQNSGPSIARTHGVKVAKNSHIFFLDADDIIGRNFHSFISFISENVQYDFYYAPLEVIKSYDQIEGLSSNSKETLIRYITKPTDFIKYGFPQPSSLVVKKSFYLANISEDRLEWGEDFLLYLLLAKYGNGIRWSSSVSYYLIDGSGRGSKLSLKLRYDLSKRLLQESSKKSKVYNSYSYTFYLTVRHILSYIYKKIRA